MILYLDASALVKRYVAELGSDGVAEAISEAEVVGTVLISRAEVTAALAKSVRVGVLTRDEAWRSVEIFRSEWSNLARVQVTESVIVCADRLAWEHGLRGYDAVHLAATSVWQEALGEPVTLMTYDRQLWEAARRERLIAYPADLPTLLETWSVATRTDTSSSR